MRDSFLPMTVARLVLVVLAVGATTAAQVGPAEVPMESLRPVDQNVGDRNVLSTSLRLMKTDLRHPMGFSEVFPTPDGERLMRVDGALYAVFPHSLYQKVSVDKGRRQITLPMVPPDTTFYIGQLDATPKEGVDPRPSSATGPEFRIEKRVATQTPPVHPTSTRLSATDQASAKTDGAAERHYRRPRLRSSVTATTIANDADYRVRRLRALMEQAAARPRQIVDASDDPTGRE